MPLRHLPIQRKLVGFIFLTTISVLVGSDVALFVYETRSSAQATSQDLQTMAEIIASNSTAALVFDDPKLAQEILSGLKAEPDVTAAAIYDRYGKLYSAYPVGPPAPVLPAAPLADGTNFGRESFQLFKPIVQGDKRVGTLYLKSDLSAMNRRLLVYSNVLLGVLLGAIFLAYIASRFLQKQISQPILNLAETAKVVTQQQDYSVRAHNPEGDELGFVTEAFNSMLEQIQLNHAILGESEERFRVVADSAPVLIWIAGTDGLLSWFNKHWLAFIGKPMEQQQAGGWKEALHPDDRAHCEAVYTAAFERKEYFRMECRVRRHDGEYRWLLNQGAPRHQGGEFAGFIGSCVDITDNKNAEEKVRLSELQMRLVTDYASVYLCQIDHKHRLKFVNRAYARRYGLENSEFIDRHLSEFMGKDAYERIRDRMDLALGGARQDFEVELPYLTLGTRWIHAVYEPQRADGGKVIGIVAVLSDITERHLAARELERARDEAVSASRAKDDFLSALSHELRTPLSPVLLLATDASGNTELTADVRADFETVRKNVELEARLIDDLLDLTRITKGKMVLEQQSVAIHAVVHDAVEKVREDLSARKIALRITLANGDPVVRGDPVRLQQVLWNVFKNAVKFTPAKGRITITTEVRETEGILAIKVADTGIGMTPGEIAQIFEAFSQGDHAKGSGSHRFGGLGLGLAISKSIVEMHSGRISAASEGRERGSTFLIELPLEVSTNSGLRHTSGDAPVADGGESVHSTIAKGAQRTILLVEDHDPTRIALERLLLRRNFRVLAVASAREARAMAETEKVDLVISDVGLPDQNGYDLMSELEERYQLKGIALSGYAMEKDLGDRTAPAFSIHLVKPVSMKALDAAIAALSPEVLQG
jgi:PAS domain S-box-containing protein